MISPEKILACILIGSGIVYFFTCLVACLGYLKPQRVKSDYHPSVSVIIAARNEEETINTVLDDLLTQDYPRNKIQIIIVDDHSEDGTKGVVETFTTKDDRILLREARFSKSPYTYKKRAIHAGIQSSTGEIILTVDADCRVPPGWISGMVEYFSPEINLVAGEVLVENGSFWGWLEALDFTGIQMMAAGLMNAGFPITCNGANLAYRRSAFERTGGFEGIGSMISGDDDLLMQKIARERPSSVIWAKGAKTAVRVKAKNNIREFLAQRTRWVSKTEAYPLRQTVVLLYVFFTFFVMVCLWLVAALFGIWGFVPFMVGYGCKVAGDALLCGYGVIKYGRPALLGMFPVAEILHIPYILGVTLKGQFGSFEWRGRRTGAVSLNCGKAVDD
ncbi:MAG TPA: glycosyltransferase [Anaerolineae bacterium]|nr:glycosyltransferase [Anaerolineae bacterium]